MEDILVKLTADGMWASGMKWFLAIGIIIGFMVDKHIRIGSTKTDMMVWYASYSALVFVCSMVWPLFVLIALTIVMGIVFF